MALDLDRYRQRVTRWCILRTSGGQTLPLARSLGAAGFDVWTPARTIRKTVRAKTPTGSRQLEVVLPILPTFVFALERDLARLADAAEQLISPHPAFSIFRHGGKTPLVSDGDVVGLRAEEQRAADAIQAMRDADTHAEAEAIRVAALTSKAARRRAMKELERANLARLRAKPIVVKAGTEVRVAEMPALAGVTGVVESIDKSFAMVRFGTQSWKIDGWRLSPYDLEQDAA